ncbi:hypothetical protein OKW30_006885 [Paraburkholderia sp. Clong3]
MSDALLMRHPVELAILFVADCTAYRPGNLL